MTDSYMLVRVTARHRSRTRGCAHMQCCTDGETLLTPTWAPVHIHNVMDSMLPSPICTETHQDLGLQAQNEKRRQECATSTRASHARLARPYTLFAGRPACEVGRATARDASPPVPAVGGFHAFQRRARFPLAVLRHRRQAAPAPVQVHPAGGPMTERSA